MILNSILRALRVASVTGIGACAVLTMAGALLVAPVARAVTPSAVSYQGLLLDSAGLPVTGVVSLKATLFDDLLAGSPLWSETHSSVDVLDGVYSVELGSITPITANILQSASVFIEIEIDSELLTPRQQLLAVPFAISAGSAAEAQNVGGVSSVFFMQMMEDFDFDGGPPSNLHASEGTSDVDGDGRANFLDADNDGDGIPDVGEPALGGDINLITPTITGYSPPTADGFDASPVSILGTNFTADSVVAFGTDSPSIVTFSANQIDVVVTPQPEGDATVTVTRPNGESATSTFSFFFYTPTITAFSPLKLTPGEVATVTIEGEHFVPGMTVDFGGQNPVPTNLTPTSLDVLVGPFAFGSVAVNVNHPNGKSTATNYPINGDRVIFLSSTTTNGDLGGLAGADAFCQSLASAALLPGVFQAWLSSSTDSPTTRLRQDLGPYTNTNGDLVANDWTDLTDGSLTNAIGYDELGAFTDLPVWTNTTLAGGPASTTNTCGDWSTSDSTPFAIFGNSGATGPNWTNGNTNQFCSAQLRLYCVGN
jgi:IPT/TIG domain